MPCEFDDDAWMHVAAEQHRRNAAVTRGCWLLGKILLVVVLSVAIAGIIVVLMGPK